jgi:hypothetical protein
MKILVDLDLLKDISYTLTMYGIPYPLLDEIIKESKTYTASNSCNCGKENNHHIVIGKTGEKLEDVDYGL